MKKVLKKIIKIIIIIIIILALVGYVGYRILRGPSVNIKEKIEIKKYAESYLTNKYGEHKFKVTGIEYQYHMAELFDHSNPTGYWVHFKSDNVAYSSLFINGLNPNDYKVNFDCFLLDYYFPNQYDDYKKMESMEPKKELEAMLLNELQNEFEPDAYEVECDSIYLSIPEDYGKIPTLVELKTNTNLYKVGGFSYKVSNTILDTNEYEERLKSYIINKYNSNSNIHIYFSQRNTGVSVDF